ncbi:Uncharacterised protein [Bordetella pertussis]|nr:Uncharacterised protein [Bordetella pertussis]
MARDGGRHGFTLHAQRLAQARQVAVVGLGAHIVGGRGLGQRRVGPALGEFQHADASAPASAQHPSQPHAGSQRLVQRCAIDHVAAVVP